MATYNSPGYANRLGSPQHGESLGSNRFHEIIAVPSSLATNDVINVRFLPRNAVVTGLNIKAQSQLDANSAPTLAFDVGTAGNPQLFNAATVLVGRAAGASADTSLTATGRLYKNTTGGDQLVIATCHTAAATPQAGNLEVEMSYFVEEQSGSPA